MRPVLGSNEVVCQQGTAWRYMVGFEMALAWKVLLYHVPPLHGGRKARALYVGQQLHHSPASATNNQGLRVPHDIQLLVTGNGVGAQVFVVTYMSAAMPFLVAKETHESVSCEPEALHGWRAGLTPTLPCLHVRPKSLRTNQGVQTPSGACSKLM